MKNYVLLQYVIVIVLCGGFLLTLSLFDPISPKGWFEYFRSFTIPYIIIAAMYYSLYDEAKKQDKIIKEIQEGKIWHEFAFYGDNKGFF